MKNNKKKPKEKTEIRKRTKKEKNKRTKKNLTKKKKKLNNKKRTRKEKTIKKKKKKIKNWKKRKERNKRKTKRTKKRKERKTKEWKKKKNQKNEKTKRKTSWDVDYGSLVEALFVYYTDIRTNEEEEDDRQAEAAGVAEGYLTSFLVTKYYEGSYCISVFQNLNLESQNNTHLWETILISQN